MYFYSFNNYIFECFCIKFSCTSLKTHVVLFIGYLSIFLEPEVKRAKGKCISFIKIFPAWKSHVSQARRKQNGHV